MDALVGFEIGPAAGSCGTAMYRKQTVITPDIDNDPLWRFYKHLILPYGFRACWSHPILLEDGTVLGSFAMYYREVRAPDADDLTLLDVATHIASIAIERARREEELQRHRHHLQELVDQRTLELQQAKGRAEEAVEALTSTNLELAQALSVLGLAQDELVRSKKLRALSSLVAGIAHELNTPLGNCLTTASALHDQTESWENKFVRDGREMRRSDLENFLGNVHVASDLLTRNLERAARLISSFKQVAVDSGNTERSSFALHKLVADVVATLRPTFAKPAIVVTQQIEPEIVMESYPNALSKLLANLLENSVMHAFDGRTGGNVVITAHKIDSGDIEMCLRDDGVGIASENLDRIFDPFFTTKFGSGGCGLGLNVVHNILGDILGGSIRCTSTPGQGTAFSMIFPAVAP
jgi:signal transduction histidine kinase